MDQFLRNKVEISEAIGHAMDKGYDEFMSWFNKAESAEIAVVRGAWDFSFYFITPEIAARLKRPEDKTCLEIGYGGGRLLNASRSYFRHSHGVDIHPFAKHVAAKLLELQPQRDFTLHTLDSCKMPIETASIDYAYSFIVIQHFYDVSIFLGYLAELNRVVKSGGLVNLFFADFRFFYDKIGLKERLPVLRRGYLHHRIPPSDTTAHNTLWMTRRYVRKALVDNGFIPVASRPSYRNVPDGYPDVVGTQTGILAKRC